jgi:hypothetical protein
VSASLVRPVCVIADICMRRHDIQLVKDSSA